MATRTQPRPAVPAALHWLERRDLTLDDIAALVQVNAFADYDQLKRLELIDGVLIDMAAKGRRHEVVREELSNHWTREAPFELFVTVEPQFNLSAGCAPQPDLLVRPRGIKTPDLKGPEVLLVVEVADTSLPFDLKTKSVIYAAHGVREYWVINANSLVTTVHLGATPTGYGSVVEVSATQLLVPSLASALALQLDQLDI
jgi:Uma2 family endonuclease